MKLEDVTAEIRPRVPWESIDLGCAIARQNIKVIWKSWLVTVVPLWCVLALLFKDYPWLFLFLLWWLKPIYDRVILFIVSRALFGAAPGVNEVFRAWPKLLFNRLWKALVLRRLSPSRSLTLPVSELEGLKGKAYTQRVSLLEVNGGEGASIATFAGLLLEFVAFAGVMMLVYVMVPGQLSESWGYAISELVANDDFSQFSDSLIWVIAVIWMLAITLMEPFYVSAGFALYVNSRTLTEGWDIELAFKRMGARIKTLKNGVKKTMLLLVMLGCLITTDKVFAQSGETEASIDEIMNSDDFTIHTKIEKVRVDNSDLSFDWQMPSFIGVIGHAFFYVILVLVIGGLGYLIYKNRHLFGGVGSRGVSLPSSSKTVEVMGMEITPESLPTDVVSAARHAWQTGDHQLALSLLYRGSIVWFVNQESLPLKDGDTENDCLRYVDSMENQNFTPYFRTLTQAWVSIAYGKRAPDDEVMLDLCDSWPFVNEERRGG